MRSLIIRLWLAGLVLGSLGLSNAQAQVPLANIAKIAAGSTHTCALTTAGGVKCWGYNGAGQLGDNSTTNRLTPVDVIGLSSGVTAITAGSVHSCALTSGGGVKCWGYNGNGRLGDNSTTSRLTPVDVTGLTSGVTAISAGGSHTCAVTTEFRVKCWGYNGQGQLGDNSTTASLTPVDVFLDNWAAMAIAAGGNHTCAVAHDVRCWGGNYGLTPVRVLSSSSMAALTAGEAHGCALGNTGFVACWGNNGQGQLGNDSTTSSLMGVNVSGLSSGVTAIAAGDNQSCALTTAGGVKCWGYNGQGQLGDNSTTNRLTPVDVSGLSSGATGIAAGGHHSCALTAGGGVKCWGSNTNGQLGDNSTTSRLTPVDVLFVPPAIYGIVTDLSTGTPIPSVTVSIAGGPTTQTTVDGHYLFWSLDPGVHSVTFSKSGYQTASISDLEVTGQGALRNVQLTTPGLLNITSTSLQHAETDVAYNDAVRAIGGSWPYKFSLAYGSLPPGLRLDEANGNIFDKPAATGAYTFAIGVTDKFNAYAEREFTIEVTQPLRITTPSLRRPTLDVDYFQTIEASGGTQPYVMSKSAGTLPPGLAIAANGNITGRPTALGTSQFTERVTDASGRYTEKNFSLEVVNPLLIATTRLNDGVVDVAHNQTLSASGGFGAYTWTVYWGELPPGLELNPQTGVISGTPTAATYGVIVFAVADEDGRVSYKDFRFTVAKPLKIVDRVPDGFKLTQYSEAIRLDGGIGPYRFSIDHTDNSRLPDGLALNEATGVISGTPTGAALTNTTFIVTDSGWPVAQTVTQRVGIRVTSVLTVTTSAVLPMERKDKAISPIVMAAQGGASPYVWDLVAGYLPQGISLSPQTGELAGTPTDRGDFVFTLKVTDALGRTAQKEFFWHVSDTLTVDTGALPDGAVDVPYSFPLNAKGGLPLYAWRLKSGTLPYGLSINPNTGTLSGRPTTKQTFSFTVEVSDADNPAQKAEKTYSMDVVDTLYVYTKSLPSGRVGEAYTATVKAELGTPPYSWRLVESGGELPAGLRLETSPTVATLTGKPEKSGVYSFTLEVADKGTPVNKALKHYTVEIFGDVKIISTALRTATRSVQYSDNIVAAGGALPYSYVLAAGDLPAGLKLNSLSGNISGVTNMPTGFSAAFRVKVGDAGTPSDSVEQDFAIYVVDPLSISTQVIQGALQGSLYQANLEGLGGLSPYQWSVQGGGLPSGLQIDAATGAIAGTPIECGSFPFTVQLADAAPMANRMQRAFDLRVTCNGTLPPVSTTINLNAGWNLMGNGLATSLDAVATFGSVEAPVAGVSDKVVSVWKWLPATGQWAFHTPRFSAAELAAYAAGRGQVVLTTIEPGEGFWINASDTVDLPVSRAQPVVVAAGTLLSGWSLLAIGDSLSPAEFEQSVGGTPAQPAFKSLWAWDNLAGRWYFFSPLLHGLGSTVAADYAARHGYLDFLVTGKRLGIGIGFWVNR